MPKEKEAAFQTLFPLFKQDNKNIYNTFG